MKLLFIISLFIYFNAGATTYYVANSGNDMNAGTSIGAAWQTLSKVSSFTFLSGDSILLKKGDTWNEKLIVPHSFLYFGSYGTGARPLITGFQTLSAAEFIDSSNIWIATATSAVNNLNTVLIDGLITGKGRYPNNGYLTFNTYAGDSSITGLLSGTPNYTGAQVAIRSAHWILDVTNITSQSGGTINFSPKLTYIPNIGGNGYFIENSVQVLDTTNEWAYKNATKKLYIYSTNEVAPDVQISTLDTLVSLKNKNSVTFNGLSFYGANFAAINIDQSRDIVIKNCDFNNNGHFGVFTTTAPKLSILNSIFNNTMSMAIYAPWSDSVTISNNYIKNTGVLLGMAEKIGYDARLSAIMIQGLSAIITNNRIDSTAYLPIYCISKNALIKNNFISIFCFNADDGGGIYIVSNGSQMNDSGTVIRSNIVINGIGTPQGTIPISQPNGAAGIYLDNYSLFVTVDSNSVANCQLAGININEAHDLTITNNNIFLGNDYTYKKGSSGINIFGDNSLSYNLKIRHNNIAVIADSIGSYVINRYHGTISGIDSNYYSYQNNQSPNFNSSGTSTHFNQWVNSTGNDIHSISQPSFIVRSATPIFVYNPSQVDSTILLSGNYIDIKGNTYFGSILIQPYKSAILYPYFSRIFSNLRNTKLL